MKRAFITLAIAALCTAPLRADMSVKLTMTIEGALAGAMGGALPVMTLHIKGTKARSDIEVNGNTTSTLIDVGAKEVYTLDSATKTAQLVTAGSAAPAVSAAATVLSKTDLTYKPTGQKRTIEGAECEEHTFALKIGMAELAPPGTQLSPEALEAMKGAHLVANGSLWLAKSGPGAAEFIAFQKAALDAKVLGAMMGGSPAAGEGLEKLMTAASSAPGLPYLSEITLTIEGTGPLVDMMKAMGPMKMIQKASGVKTGPLPDDMFKVPADYKIEKK